MSKCIVCGKNAYSNYCVQHKPRKPLKRTAIKPKLKTKQEKEDNTKKIQRQWAFFLEIWNERPHKSEVSGEPLPTPSTLHFHHILPKSDKKYKVAEFDKENIILLTWDEHDTIEKFKDYFEEINKRRHHLLNKYNLT